MTTSRRAAGPQDILDRLVDLELASAAAGWIGTPGGRLWSGAAGRTRRRGGAGASLGTKFDLASLTKPFTATLAMVLDRSGEMPLSLPIGEIWPRASVELARRPLESLLRHRSGLLAWTPLALRCRAAAQTPTLLVNGTLCGAAVPTYSDLGYILWALAAQERLGVRFADLLRSRVLAPLPAATAIAPPPGPRPQVAHSLLDGSRESALAGAQGLTLEVRKAPRPGDVQDGNARFLGGLSGHAGLFGDVAGVAALAAEWLRPRRLLADGDAERCLAGPPGEYGLGWARRRRHGSAGAALSRRAFGHTGFTGGSLWSDPETGVIAVLLTHRTASTVELNPWRRGFHRASRALVEESAWVRPRMP